MQSYTHPLTLNSCSNTSVCQNYRQLIDRVRANLFTSKLTSRLPKIGYFGCEVKSRVQELTFVAFIQETTNQSLLIRELNLVHITTP